MIRFNESDHTYTVDGKPAPSVSELIRMINAMNGKPDIYATIPEDVLRKAADFGTAIHLAIELHNETGMTGDLPDGGEHCLNDWLRLKGDIKTIDSEKMVHYKDWYAGTVDLIGHEGDRLIIADYKTSSKLYTDNVTLQLNLYRLAYERMTGLMVDTLRAYWLPKRQKGKAVDLEMIPDDELVNMVVKALKSSQNISKTQEIDNG